MFFITLSFSSPWIDESQIQNERVGHTCFYSILVRSALFVIAGSSVSCYRVHRSSVDSCQTIKQKRLEMNSFFNGSYWYPNSSLRAKIKPMSDSEWTCRTKLFRFDSPSTSMSFDGAFIDFVSTCAWFYPIRKWYCQMITLTTFATGSSSTNRINFDGSTSNNESFTLFDLDQTSIADSLLQQISSVRTSIDTSRKTFVLPFFFIFFLQTKYLLSEPNFVW